MYKLGLEKADEPEIKSPTSGGSQKKQENSKKTSTSASVIMLKPLTVWITTNHGKFLDMGILDLLTCLQRILYAGQEVTELDVEQQTGSKLGKEYIRAVYCHPAYLIYMQRTSCKMPGWMKHTLESRLLREISITSDMQLTSYGRKWRGTNEPLDERERTEWKSWLKAQYQKTKIMASGPITSWEIDGETMEIKTDFIFLGSKITVDGDSAALLTSPRLFPSLWWRFWKKSHHRVHEESPGTEHRGACLTNVHSFPLAASGGGEHEIPQGSNPRDHRKVRPFPKPLQASCLAVL